jgi:ATPase family associated with various cellular activities (AAA)
MGILGSAEVVECSASDLVGQYVGHTGPKTKKLFEKALGKVLFVDEAYRLSQGNFAQEAIDELVGLITHPTFKSKLIIILAGYEQDMNNLMSVNTGLSSRFPDQIVFTNMRARDCLQVVLKELTKKKIRFPELEDESSAVYRDMEDLVEDLANLPNWGNARDMMTLSKELISKALLLDSNTGAEVQLAGAAALDILAKMVADRERRSNIPLKARTNPTLPVQTFTREPPPPPKVSTEATVAKPETPSPLPTSPVSRGIATRSRGRRRGGVNRQAVQHRDPNVSDTDWNTLQAAIRANEEGEREAKKAINALEKSIATHRKNEEVQREELRKSQQKEAEAKDAKERAGILREREKARLKEQAARRAHERAVAELQAKKEQERRQREQEEKAQRKLRELGVCINGYRWIKVDNGYQCAGGYHFVSASQLGL